MGSGPSRSGTRTGSSRIEEAVGVGLPAPERDGALYGLRIRGRIYSDRHFEGIYGAWRMRELMRSASLDGITICEIGGGGGHLAFYARLPEMPAAVAQGHIDRVGEGQLLLSINQESGAMVGPHPQNVVRELAAAASLKRRSRHPFWMRTGYVEETCTRR